MKKNKDIKYKMPQMFNGKKYGGDVVLHFNGSVSAKVLKMTSYHF